MGNILISFWREYYIAPGKAKYTMTVEEAPSKDSQLKSIGFHVSQIVREPSSHSMAFV
jgi:hypothetical protein